MMSDNNKNPNNGTVKTIAMVISIITVIVAGATIMQNKLDAMSKQIDKLEERTKVGIFELDVKLQLELGAVDEKLEIEIEDLNTLLQFEIKSSREYLLLKIDAHEQTLGHEVLFNEVRNLWRYHEKPVKGAP